MAGPSPLFIVNHLSERVAKKGSVLDTIAANQAIPCHALGTFETLPDIVQKAASDGTAHVFIEGGDGTVQGVLTEFLRQKEAFNRLPAFSIVPGGMTNQVAKNIGLKSAQRSLIEQVISEPPATRTTAPLLSVTSLDNDPFYGFLFSTGAVPMVTAFTKSEIHNRGIGGSMAVAGGILRGISGNREEVMQATPITMQINGSKITEDHLGTLVTTLPGLILGLDPFWGTGDGPLRVTYARGDARRLYRHVAGLWVGEKTKDRSDDGLQSWNTDHLSYQYDGPVVLDGEPLDFPSGTFEIGTTSAIEFIA